MKEETGKGVWIRPSFQLPPNGVNILVVTTSGLILYSVRADDKYRCCTVLPEGVGAVELDVSEIQLFMIPDESIESETYKQIVTNERRHNEAK